MTKFIFHGRLGEAIGKEWHLQVRSVAEAIRAIEAMTKRLCPFLIDNDKKGVGYRVIFGERDLQDKEEIRSVLTCDTVHIIPVIQGSDKKEEKAWYQVLAGVVLIALSFIPGLGQFAGILFMLGLSLTLGGIAQLIAGTPENNSAKNAISSNFGGQVNTLQQGAPVPVGYGECIIGSHTISISLESVDTEIT